MKKRVILGLSLAVLLSLAVPASAVFSADTGTIICQVTPQIVAIEVDKESIDYGNLSLNAVSSNQPLVVTNSGNVNAKLSIACSNATGDTNWTLIQDKSAVLNIDQFKHWFSIDGANNWTALSNSYQTLATSVAKNRGKQELLLQLRMPPKSTDQGSKTITVTIQAAMADVP